MARVKIPLGKILIQQGEITQDQLETALVEQKKTKEQLGAILLRMGFITGDAILGPVLADQLGVDFYPLKGAEVSPNVIAKLPAKVVNHYHVMPVDIEDDTLVVAMRNPLDVNMIDDLEMLAKMGVRAVFSNDKDIDDAIRQYYGLGAETIEKMMSDKAPDIGSFSSVETIDEIGSEASIGKFLNQIILEAYRDRATDIHIEPFEEQLRIRYRIDGVLYDAKTPSDLIHFRDALNSRIKVLANLDIAEKRLPQDGRFKVRISDVDLDLRVAFLPTPYGQGVVIRILNALTLLSLNELGLPEHGLKILQQLIEQPHGIIFVTGPTGSGKTTTLYTCLSKLNTEHNKIITIEDPVEYQIKGITQIQVNPQISLTFAKGLRSMLRFDPDIMMVGEVRDLETAQITIQAALTGHLVFSTLHTNDSTSGVARLMDMGVEPFLISSAVECFIAQRLIRRLCPHCKQSVEVSAETFKRLGITDVSTQGKTFYKQVGCQRCRMTGYMGREAVYEFLMMDEHIKQLILNHASAGEIKKHAQLHGFKTLVDHAFIKAGQGITSVEEVFRLSMDNMTGL